MRSTLADVAREAGVSPATVDRVLNNRPGVRPRTRHVVFQTARRLGYIGEETLPDGSADAAIRLDFVLPVGSNTFIRTLHDQLSTQAAQRPGIDVRITAIESFNPETLADALHGLQGRTAGVGLIALDHPTVREAVRMLSRADVKVVTLATDILHVPRIGYVGIDNRQAGRLAGYVLGRLLGRSAVRKVAMFAGSLSYRGHQEREMGFRHVLSEEFPKLEIVELREMGDDRERAYREARALLDRHEDLAGIYNIGAGNSGIAQALHERGRERSTVFLGHELTEGTKRLLLDGTLDAVIDQNPRVEAREALNMLVHAVRNLPYEGHPPRLHLVLKENIPEV
ncbi:MAG: LacI family transcriptional regulator [Mesorhizobium amorphae]|nr:MAG: LacI family transcriptional regulator [Mesorhizobium amorphae]